VTVDGTGEWLMCVRDEAEQDKWCDVLAKNVSGGPRVECEVKEKVVVEATQDAILEGAAHSGALKKQSELDPTAYNERFFILKGAELAYQKTDAHNSRVLGKIDLNTVLTCTPMKVLYILHTVHNTAHSPCVH
jgi:hypothetical protein